MKNIKSIITYTIIIAAIIIIVAFFVRYSNESIKEELNSLKKDREELTIQLNNYSKYIDSTNIVLDTYKDSIIKLNNIKSKIEIKYEVKYKDFSNPSITSNDAVISYISSKIHNK